MSKDKDKIEVIIKALRCSATPYQVCDEECPYRLLEDITDNDFPIKSVPDVVDEDGRRYWISCNCDAIANDAADALEDFIDE